MDAKVDVRDYRGRGALPAEADRLAAAAAAAEQLLIQAEQHRAGAEQARQVVAQHEPRLAGLQRRVAERAAALRSVQERADRPLIGRIHAGALADARDDHDHAAQALAQARQTIEHARAAGYRRDQEAARLVDQAVTGWLDAGGRTRTRDLTTHSARHLDRDQILDQLTPAVAQARRDAAADTARRDTRLQAITTELAHREALPPGVARGADTARVSRATQQAAGRRARDAAGPRHRPPSHNPSHGAGPEHHGPSR